jgi:hypothetical protein
MFNLPFACARHDMSDPAWIAARIDVYLRFTVRSLRRQTDGDFGIWLDCRPGSEGDLAMHTTSLAKAGVIAAGGDFRGATTPPDTMSPSAGNGPSTTAGIWKTT